MKGLRLIFEVFVLLVNYTIIDLALSGMAMCLRTSWFYILVFACGCWAIGKLNEDLDRLLHRRWLSWLLTLASFLLYALLAIRLYGPAFL